MRLFRGRRFTLTTGQRARGCLKYTGRLGACWLVRRGRGVGAISPSDVDARRCRCAARCVRGDENCGGREKRALGGCGKLIALVEIPSAAEATIDFAGATAIP